MATAIAEAGGDVGATDIVRASPEESLEALARRLTHSHGSASELSGFSPDVDRLRGGYACLQPVRRGGLTLATLIERAVIDRPEIRESVPVEVPRAPVSVQTARQGRKSASEWDDREAGIAVGLVLLGIAALLGLLILSVLVYSVTLGWEYFPASATEVEPMTPAG